jgi:hypothetical protein
VSVTVAEVGTDYEKVPRIASDDVTLLWYTDFWDGPWNGVLLFRNERCWFETVVDEPKRRIALVLKLRPEQLEEEDRWHQLFREKVGRHTDFVPGRRWSPDLVEPVEKHHEFYEPYAKRTPLDVSHNEVLGWFVL